MSSAALAGSGGFLALPSGAAAAFGSPCRRSAPHPAAGGSAPAGRRSRRAPDPGRPTAHRGTHAPDRSHVPPPPAAAPPQGGSAQPLTSLLQHPLRLGGNIRPQRLAERPSSCSSAAASPPTCSKGRPSLCCPTSAVCWLVSASRWYALMAPPEASHPWAQGPLGGVERPRCWRTCGSRRRRRRS